MSDPVERRIESPSGIQRILITVFVADFVGFSRLMAKAEDETVRLLKAHRGAVDGIIELHGGRIFNTAGDSILAEFRSPVEAVRSAVEVQEALRTRNLNIPDDRRLELRIGINLGDVVVQGSDFLGDGVNVAARLQSIAEPGGICISASVREQLLGKIDLRFDALGPQTLKNIPRPIEAFRIAGTGGATIPPDRSGMSRWALVRVAGMGVAVLLAISAGGWWFAHRSPAPEFSHVRPIHPLSESAVTRARAAAAREGVILPRFEIPRLADDVPAALRRFVGIWYNEVGFEGGAGRRVMLIVTSVDAHAKVWGYYMLGRPGPNSPESFGGRVSAFAGEIKDGRLAFRFGHGSTVRAAFASGDRLFLVHERSDGLMPSVILNPIWQLEE
jgi:class 3 adenylate cyclase